MAIKTKNLILRTARKQFIQKGYALTKMQEIADEAKINKASLHYYFRTKELLYQEVLHLTVGQLFPKLAQALSQGKSFFENTNNLVEAYIDTLSEHPEIPLFIFSEISQNKLGFIKMIKNETELLESLKIYLGTMNAEMENGIIYKMDPMQLLMNIVSMTVFPFIAKPVILNVFNFTHKQYKALMNDRKAVVKDFIKRSLEVKTKID